MVRVIDTRERSKPALRAVVCDDPLAKQPTQPFATAYAAERKPKRKGAAASIAVLERGGRRPMDGGGGRGAS